MNREPVVVQEGAREWETWPNEEEVGKRGLVYFKTLVHSDVTRGGEFNMGIAKIPPGEALREHRQAEIYLILEGTGVVEIDSGARSVGVGSAVFIPGDALHSCENTGTSE